MSSLGTDDLESVAWGIDVKPRSVSRLSGTTDSEVEPAPEEVVGSVPRSVSRLSGTTTIEVEPAPEEVDWINPIFRPFDVNGDDDSDGVDYDVQPSERDAHVGGGVTEDDFECAMDGQWTTQVGSPPRAESPIDAEEVDLRIESV